MPIERPWTSPREVRSLAFREKEEALPLRRHTVPARRHRIVSEQIPVAPVVKLAAVVGYLVHQSSDRSARGVLAGL
jgi:hypothetical protein